MNQQFLQPKSIDSPNQELIRAMKGDGEYQQTSQIPATEVMKRIRKPLSKSEQGSCDIEFTRKRLEDLFNAGITQRTNTLSVNQNRIK